MLRQFSEIKDIFDSIDDIYTPFNSLTSLQPVRFFESNKDYTCSSTFGSLTDEELERHAAALNNRKVKPLIKVNTFKQTTKDIISPECPEEIMTDEQLIEHCNHNYYMNILGVVCKTCNLLLERV